MRVIFLLLAGTTAFAQQVSFTSRTYVYSPVAILAVGQSKDFGFNSITIRNDAGHAIAAIRFLIMFRSEAGDEIADERRVPVNVDPRETRRFDIGLGQIEGLKQLARSRRQPNALAILTIEAVEYTDGSEWKQSERDQGTPIDPLKPPDLRKGPSK